MAQNSVTLVPESGLCQSRSFASVAMAGTVWDDPAVVQVGAQIANQTQVVVGRKRALEQAYEIRNLYGELVFKSKSQTRTIDRNGDRWAVASSNGYESSGSSSGQSARSEKICNRFRKLKVNTNTVLRTVSKQLVNRVDAERMTTGTFELFNKFANLEMTCDEALVQVFSKKVISPSSRSEDDVSRSHVDMARQLVLNRWLSNATKETRDQMKHFSRLYHSDPDFSAEESTKTLGLWSIAKKVWARRLRRLSCSTAETLPTFQETTDFQVFVRSFDKTKVVQVSSTDPISSVKSKLGSHFGIDPGQQILRYDGRQLNDNLSVRDCAITAESTLYLLCRIRGGAESDDEFSDANPVAEKTIVDEFPPTSQELSEIPLPKPMTMDISSLKGKEKDIALDKIEAVNRLRKERTTLYQSITRMNNKLQKDSDNGVEYDIKVWNRYLNQVSNTQVKLTHIRVNIFELLPTFKDDDKNYDKYFGILIEMIDKITRIMDQWRKDLLEKNADALKRTPDTVERQDKSLTNVLRKLTDVLDKTKEKPNPDYSGVKRLEVKKFSGDENDYPFFKSQFKTAMEGRRFSKKDLALRLFENLTGTPEKLLKKHISTNVSDSTYDRMWEILEDRFGGQYLQDSNVYNEFRKLVPLRDYSVKELERVQDTLFLVRIYFEDRDKSQLTSNTSWFLRETKEKFSSKQSRDYIRFCEDFSHPDTFASILAWIKYTLKVSRRAEREFSKDGGKATSKNSSHYQTDDDQDHDGQFYDGFYHVDDERSDQNCDDFTDEILAKQAEMNLLIQKQHDFIAKRSWGVRNPENDFRGIVPRPRFGERPPFRPFTGAATRQPFRFNSQPTFRPLKSLTWDGKACPICKTEHDLSACTPFKKLILRERFAIVRSFQICYHCLRGGHRVKDCTFKKDKTCGVGGCIRYHHQLLHPDASTNFIDYEDRDSTCSELPDLRDIDDGNLFHVASPGTISLQTVVVNLTAGSGGMKQVVVLLDSGSQSTCIDEDFAERLKLPISMSDVKRTVGYADREVKIISNLVQFEITSLDGLVTQTMTGWTIKNLASGTGIVDWSKEKRNFKHLANLPFHALPKEPRIIAIIGTGYAGLFKASAIKEDKTDILAPMGLLTPFGWTAVGASAKKSNYNFISDNGEEVDTLCYFDPILMNSKSSLNSD